MPIVLSVDLGTTKITSIAIDASSGRITAIDSASNNTNITHARDHERGYSEWNADEIIATGIRCLAGVAKKLRSHVRDVVGLGITGQQHGMVLVDSRTRSAVSPLINWQDRRSLQMMPNSESTWLDAARLAIGQETWKRTGCWLHPGFMAVTLFELNRRHAVPDHSQALFIMDYFGALLTGKPPTTEPSCAGSSGVFDVRSRQWNEEAIKSLELPRSLFPEIYEANETIGGLTAEAAQATGLRAGTPVFAAIGDHQASFLGSVADRRNSVLVNVGTGAQVAVYTDGLDFESPIELRPFPCGGNLLSNVGLAGGWSYQVLENFFLDVGHKLYGIDAEDDLYQRMTDTAADIGEGADGLRCDPTFSGSRINPTVRGSITGLSPFNFTASHLARAVLEGMSRSLHEGFNAIQKTLNCSPTILVSAGNGLRKNRLLAEIVSKAFRLPLTLTNHQEEAAFGAGLVASVGANIFANIEEAARSLIQNVSNP